MKVKGKTRERLGKRDGESVLKGEMVQGKKDRNRNCGKWTERGRKRKGKISREGREKDEGK